ncbi:MAG: hypothetical protein Kow00121_08730 [Elainellaceae cyanobacterium]
MLQLLALQKAEHAWAVLNENNSHFWVEADEYNEGALVLVELTPTKQVQHIHDAAHWVLEIIEQYLTLGVNPASLQEEVQRAEQWRQSLTLQSQELGRRNLEIEARRDQIQELEESLKHEKQAVDEIMAQLKKASAQLKVDINFPEFSDNNGILDRPSPEYSSPNSPAE